ncbi:MAG: GDSL-type esterase/lipase family protein [Tannerella sp.]|jgi:lysophospholipase L1-like esterase|nr:GDSL-type esterase/lipase family protein [Tannerella sp.]
MGMKDLWKDKTGNITVALGGLVAVLFIVSAGKLRAVENTDIPAVSEVNETSNLSSLMDSVCSSLPFINDTLCVINDLTNSLQPFMNALKELREGKDTVVSIIHLGDSHIQAGYLSGQTMRMLQTSFGNAGRGWIAPFKLSKANEPSDYFISSNIREWTAGRCIQSTPKCPWGIGGIGIQTSAPEIDFNLIIAPNNGAGYSFNKVLLYRDRNAMPMAPSLYSYDSIAALSWGEQLCENIVVDTFMTTNLLDTFHLKSIGKGKDSIRTNRTPNNLYYGFMLMNSHPGILYHAIGVNGARYVDYTSRSYVRQLALLKPSLLIVSLGTNEAFGRNFSKEQFSSQVDAFIRLIKEELPETALLITTPAESYKRTYKNKKRYYVRNDNISRVADAITTYTREQGVACWDLFSITGGYNSCKKWFDAGMFGRDRIHFSREGYGEQGVLLYKALVRSCIDQYTNHEILAADTENLSAEDLIISDMRQSEFAAGAPEEAEEFISGETVPEETDSEEDPAKKDFIEIESGKKDPAKKEEAQDVE